MKPVEFVSPLVLVLHKDGIYYLHANFIVALYGELLSIPSGFHTDLASVPRIPFAFLLFGDRGGKAGVLHDYLYDTAMFDRKTCDEYFHKALLECYADFQYSKKLLVRMYQKAKIKSICYSMYLGVRVGGGAYYNANLKKLKSVL